MPSIPPRPRPARAPDAFKAGGYDVTITSEAGAVRFAALMPFGMRAALTMTPAEAREIGRAILAHCWAAEREEAP
jgi:hypothetical protein